MGIIIREEDLRIISLDNFVYDYLVFDNEYIAIINNKQEAKDELISLLFYKYESVYISFDFLEQN